VRVRLCPPSVSPDAPRAGPLLTESWIVRMAGEEGAGFGGRGGAQAEAAAYRAMELMGLFKE
jgi:hypothetical protein